MASFCVPHVYNVNEPVSQRSSVIVYQELKIYCVNST